MHDNGIEELITKLYDMVQDARSLPLGADKCIVEREKVLDMLDEISNRLPGELKQAKTIVDSRNELIAKAKREVEGIQRQAQSQAKQLVSQEAVYQEAQNQADEMIRNAQAKIKELRQVTNDYVDDSLKRTEEAIAEALGQIRETRGQFRKLVNPQERSKSPIKIGRASCTEKSGRAFAVLPLIARLGWGCFDNVTPIRAHWDKFMERARRCLTCPRRETDL